MCGIAGIYDLKGKREVDRNALARMSDALAHRGPDDCGRFVAPGIGLVHRRLAIIDKEGGVQPFTASNDDVIVFNGEIYNHAALRQSLAERVDFKTRSDTEVLAEGLSLSGSDFIEQLRGMFAFAHWSAQTQCLTLARDRLGERPLYYALSPDGFFLFASEINAITASGMIARVLDPQAFADYCYYGYVPDPKSIYRGVKKLPPAHIMTVNRVGGSRLERYWRPAFASNTSLSLEQASDVLLNKIDDAVRAQMISDAPIGAFLSGGVDSAGIFASMARHENIPLLTACTMGFQGAANDERADAKSFAETLGARHISGIAKADSADLIDKVAKAFGEPFADSSALPSYLVAKLARQHMTVALTGDGGDEIFAGYRRHRFFLAEEHVRQLAPRHLRYVTFGAAGVLYPKLDWAPRPLRLKTTLQELGESSGMAYAAACAITLPERAAAMLSDDVRRSLNGYRPETVVMDAMDESGTDDPLARAQYVDLKTWLPGRMLVKLDRSSMAHGLETRPPLLDHKLVEWAGELPSAYKLKSGTGKRILKKALHARLGESHLQRNKQGFALPLSSWLGGQSPGPLDRFKDSTLWRECGLYNEAKIERMVADHVSGKSNCAQEIWSVIMFDAFLRAA